MAQTKKQRFKQEKRRPAPTPPPKKAPPPKKKRSADPEGSRISKKVLIGGGVGALVAAVAVAGVIFMNPFGQQTATPPPPTSGAPGVVDMPPASATEIRSRLLSQYRLSLTSEAAATAGAACESGKPVSVEGRIRGQMKTVEITCTGADFQDVKVTDKATGAPLEDISAR